MAANHFSKYFSFDLLKKATQKKKKILEIFPFASIIYIKELENLMMPIFS